MQDGPRDVAWMDWYTDESSQWVEGQSLSYEFRTTFPDNDNGLLATVRS